MHINIINLIVIILIFLGKVTMKKFFNTMTRKFTIFFLISSLSVTQHIYTMDQNQNNCITVVNKNDNSNLLLQLCFMKTEYCSTAKKYISFGMNMHIYKPDEIKCLLMKENYYKQYSLLQIVDPHSNQKNITLKLKNEDSITIHAKEDNKIIITKGPQSKIIGYLTYY